MSKSIRRATYWYAQRTAGIEKRQIYLGRETSALLKWMHDAEDARRSARADEASRAELVRMLAAGGAARETGAVVQTLRILAGSAGLHPLREHARRPLRSAVRGRDIRIDFLTTTSTRRVRGPLQLQQFGITAHPMPNIDYLIAEPVQAVVIGGSGTRLGRRTGTPRVRENDRHRPAKARHYPVVSD